jgi:hypothetical protein
MIALEGGVILGEKTFWKKCEKQPEDLPLQIGE